VFSVKHFLAALAVLCLSVCPAFGGATTDRSCLTPDTRAILESAEAHFNTHFIVVSTCRPGAVIAGTHDASQHRYGRAVDLLVPRGVSKRAVVRWLFANAPGVTMTYARMAHVHFDTGPYHALACGGCGRRARTVRRSVMARHDSISLQPGL
jgi:uncharacterized protein YcbK (DUF882 family)